MKQALAILIMGVIIQPHMQIHSTVHCPLALPEGWIKEMRPLEEQRCNSKET